MKIKPRKILYLAPSLLLMSGCVATVTESGYYWGKYANTLYDYEKTPSEETMLAHKTELESIINESEQRQLKTPPGVHAELGFLHAKLGNQQQASSNYQKEMALYPESTLFLERLITQQQEGQ